MYIYKAKDLVLAIRFFLQSASYFYPAAFVGLQDNLVFCRRHSGCEAVKLSHQIFQTKENDTHKQATQFHATHPFEYCMVKKHVNSA